MDKRRKLTPEQVDEVLAMVDKGMTLESVGRAMGVSTSHVQRMRATRNKGEVKAKPTSLSSCMKFIAKGFPFKRVGWDNYFYYYDTENSWFVKYRYTSDHGDDYEIIWYTLDLSLESLMAKDWVVLTWDAVSHFHGCDKKVVE